MTRTELDRYYDKKVVERDGVKGQHFEQEHLR